MTRVEAEQLARKLTAEERLVGGLPVRAEVRPGACSCKPGARIAFVGRASGEHTLCVSASDEERILAHWRGYAGIEHVPDPASKASAGAES